MGSDSIHADAKGLSLSEKSGWQMMCAFACGWCSMSVIAAFSYGFAPKWLIAIGALFAIMNGALCFFLNVALRQGDREVEAKRSDTA